MLVEEAQRDAHLLIQVVARLTPARSGVTDYAIAIAEELRLRFGVRSAFVVVNESLNSQVSTNSVYCRPEQILESCVALRGTRKAIVLVHVTGYEYSPQDGAPTALAYGLEELHRSGEFRIAGFFHELYATGMPWRKAFWFSRRQRRAVAHIAQMCSHILTNTARHASWLHVQKNPITPMSLLPVSSNIGECAEPVAWNDRNPALIVFGQSDTRRRAYKHLVQMVPTLQRLKVQEIIDVGSAADVPANIGGLEVRRMGRMSSADVGDLISSTQFGFVRFAPNEMAKSSVMAALCAFGALPVLAESFLGEIDGISDGKQVITPSSIETASFVECSRAAWQWYQQHNVNAHARVYADWLMGKARAVAQ